MTTHTACNTLARPAPIPDERSVVDRARRDKGAFARLYEAHHEAIFRYLCRRTGDAHEAEDLAGEVFLAALRGIDRYRDTGGPFRAWLYGIATNHANRWARDWRRRRRRPMPADLAQAPSPRADGRIDRAQAALLAISPRLQAVMTLHYLEGLSVEHTARAIGRPVGTVKSRLKRGREAMRRQIERIDGPTESETTR